MRTYEISIGKLHIKIRSTKAHAKGQTQSSTKKTYWNIVQKAGRWSLAQLSSLLERYDHYLKKKQQEYMDSFPPHSLLCEGRCCQKSFRAYHQFLKKELQWDKNGHLR